MDDVGIGDVGVSGIQGQKLRGLDGVFFIDDGVGRFGEGAGLLGEVGLGLLLFVKCPLGLIDLPPGSDVKRDRRPADEGAKENGVEQSEEEEDAEVSACNGSGGAGVFE
jgi:hypothetical protein